MKWLSIFLSLYLSFLSCMSCTDEEVSHLSTNSKELLSTLEKQSHNEDNDLCSPFCVCNCCGAHSLSYVAIVSLNAKVNSEIIKLPLPTYKSILSSSFYGSIWQPPQIV